MSNKFAYPKAEASVSEQYRAIFGNMKLSATMLQTAMVVHLEYLSKLESKQAVMDDPGLAYLFNNAPKGIDRGALSAWWVMFSPLRPVFKANGQLELIRWAVKGKWDTDGADKTYWADCAPEPTSKPRIPEVDKAVEALVTALAKIAKAKPDTSTNELAERVAGYMPELAKAINEAMATTKVEKFAKRLDDYNKLNAA